MSITDQVLWTPQELKDYVQGRWTRRPNAYWNPRRVNIVEDSSDPNDIIFCGMRRKIPVLQSSFKNKPSAAGCIVVNSNLGNAALEIEAPVLLIDDIKESLRMLAYAARSRLCAPVIALTGTVGKTSTRQMTAHMLRAFGMVSSNRNDIANFSRRVFCDIASTDPKANYLVFEIGMGEHFNSLGDMTAALKPDISVLTSVGTAHLDTFRQAPSTEEEARELVAQQKGLVFSEMSGSKISIIHEDLLHLRGVQSALTEAHRVISFGEGNEADYQLLSHAKEGLFGRVKIRAMGRNLEYMMNNPARFMALNSLAAVACIDQLGLDLKIATETLRNFQTPDGRCNVFSISLRGGGTITVIDDAFNATPLSMGSSLAMLDELASATGGRRIAILGDILHLGANSPEIHASILKRLEAHRVDKLFTYGEQMLSLQRAVPGYMSGGHFADKSALAEAVFNCVRDRDVVTFKASTPLKLGDVARKLKEYAQA